MNPKIIISILLLSLLFIGYYFLNKKTTKKDLQPPGNAKKEPNQPDFCFGDIFPSISCDSNTVICDPILKRWRCKLDCENPETNPFPTDFQKCNITDIKCDSNGNYYCDNNYCKNGGKLYNNSSDQCSCPEEYTGKTCEILKSICHNGNSDPDDPTKCSTCCDKTTSIGGKCRHYNGPQKTCENDCDAEKKNSVYDGTKCSCPGGFIEDGTGCKATPDICNSDGTVQENGNNKIGSNGLCECKVGWEGPICQTNKCGDHGTYNTTTLTCDCENGWSGNRCQYSRDSCSNHGDPQVNDKGEFIKCKCDEGWKGNKCTCEVAAKPTEDDLYHTCRGIYSECTDNGWKQTCKNCEGIYSYFGDENKWREQCNSSIVTEVKGSSSYADDGWIAKCSPQSNCDDSQKFTAERTCNSTPTDSDLVNCKREDTYIPWTDPNYKPGEYAKISAGKTNVCVCSEEEVSGKGLYPVWKPVPITDDKRCGPMPPKGLCKSGDVVVDPHCIAPLGVNGTRAWLCPGQTLPKDIVEEVWPSLKAHELDNNKYYYTTKNGDSFNTIYPTINMDQCYNAPYDQLTSISDFGPGYQTLNSEPGFVKGLSKDNQSGTFISIDQARLPNSGFILFNQGITDNTRIDGKSFDDFSKKFSNINSISSSEYIGKKITNAEKIGGGDYYNKFMVENNVNCAKERSTDIGSQCMNRGMPVQICSDSNFNIVDCNDPKKYYQYDKVLCLCGKGLYYKSDADGQNKYYKGDRCQYSDNTTCNGKGIVQDDGTCVCNDDLLGLWVNKDNPVLWINISHYDEKYKNVTLSDGKYGIYTKLIDNINGLITFDRSQDIYQPELKISINIIDDNTINVKNGDISISYSKISKENKKEDCTCFQGMEMIKNKNTCYPKNNFTKLDVNNNILVSENGLYYMIIHPYFTYMGLKTPIKLIKDVVIYKYDGSSSRVIYTNENSNAVNTIIPSVYNKYLGKDEDGDDEYDSDATLSINASYTYIKNVNDPTDIQNYYVGKENVNIYTISISPKNRRNYFFPEIQNYAVSLTDDGKIRFQVNFSNSDPIDFSF
jgi:hypothetical protein